MSTNNRNDLFVFEETQTSLLHTSSDNKNITAYELKLVARLCVFLHLKSIQWWKLPGFSLFIVVEIIEPYWPAVVG